MKVCRYKGTTIAVLTRNEHCPPHVHVGTAKWDARFLFSFWHNGVLLWDVTPGNAEPGVTLLEEFRQVLRLPPNLRKARELWWASRQTVCLENQLWDVANEEVVSPRRRRHGGVAILAARFDERTYRTVLRLARQSECLEIEL